MITFSEIENFLKTGVGASFKKLDGSFLKKTKETVSKNGGDCSKKSGGNCFKKCDGPCDASGPLHFYEDYFSSSLEIVLQNSTQLS